jgi:Secretion system C-terminal sorting domain
MSLGTVINSMKYDVSIGLPRINSGNTLFCEVPISLPIWTNCLINNQDHLFIRHDNLLDQNNNLLFYDYSCQPTFANTIKLLNREIGDNVLNLENRILPYDAAYSAMDGINVNVRNPHYAYTTIAPTNQLLAGIYSKANVFNITSTQAIDFDVNNMALTYLPPFTGPFAVNNASWTTCCQDFRNKKDKVIPLQKKSIKDNCIIYPNPATTSCTLQFTAQQDAHSTITIYSNSGIVLSTYTFEVLKSYAQFYKTMELPPNMSDGIYIVKLKNGNQIFTNKLNKN